MSYYGSRSPVVLFDIGDVLVDTHSLMQSAATSGAEAVSDEWPPVSASGLVSTYLARDKVETRLHINHLFADREVALKAFSDLGFGRDLRMAGVFLTRYRNELRSRLVATDEIEFLRDWMISRSGALRFGVVSDGTTDEQLEILARLGLLRQMDSGLILISEQFGADKSGEQIYRAAIRESGATPNRIVMVGDHPLRDVEVPRRLGLNVVPVDRFQESRYGNALREAGIAGMKSLYDVVSAVEELLA